MTVPLICKEPQPAGGLCTHRVPGFLSISPTWVPFSTSMFVPLKRVTVTFGVTRSNSDHDLAPPSLPPQPANEITGLMVGSEKVIVTNPLCKHFDNVELSVYKVHPSSPVLVKGSMLDKRTPGSEMRPVAVKCSSRPPRSCKDSVTPQIHKKSPLTPTL